MKTVVPNYYKSFQCIADKCRHSCCIGWEIDVDEETLASYDGISENIADRLKANISFCDGQAYFRMDEKERCPFLNQTGLCDIISEMGQDAVPYICREHPRFYNELSFGYELGLGLCCEEACRIILGQKEKTELEILEDDGKTARSTKYENVLLRLRDDMISKIQNRDVPLEERLEELTYIADIEIPYLPPKIYCEPYLELESLDSAWSDLLNEYESSDFNYSGDGLDGYDTVFEKLTVYFLFRHIAPSSDNDDIFARLCFCIFSVRFIRSLCAYLLKKNGKLTFEDICEVCRMYSSEIEYSEENTAAMIDYFAIG